MRTSLTALAGVLLISSAGAHELKSGSITVEHPWARPAAAGNSAAYFVLANSGAADRLIGVSSDVAESVAMHSTTIDAQGVGRMVPVQAVDLPAGAAAAFAQVKGANPDAVFFSGYYAEAAPLVQQLKDGGVTAQFVSADGVKDPEFVKQAGGSSKDALLSCPCGPATGPFAEEYAKKFGQDAGTYSVEGYDLATIMLKGIDSGKITRPDLLEFVRTYDGQGVGRKYQWTPTGELSSTLIWMYKVQ